jgi:hypothetical protein
MTILNRVIASLDSLGGVAKRKDIHSVYKKITKPEELSKTFVQSIQERIERNSIDSDAFKEEDLFRSLYGKGKGVWFLKDKFKNIEEAKFIYEFKEKNLELWEEISKKKIHSNEYLREVIKIHRGERGIYRDLSKTKKLSFNDGICLSILDTVGNYEDILTDTYLTYSYPDTKHESRDLGEINSLKICQKYNISIFVLLGLEDDRSKKKVRLGYVQSYNDKQKTFLISFIDNKDILINPIEEVIEHQNDEEFIELFDNSRKKKKSTFSNRNNNQPKFNFDVFKYYENECAVCTINHFLEAAHIIPVRDKGSDNKKNGLILCKNHHKAFDDIFFKINPENLKIEIIKEDKISLKVTKDNIQHLTNKPGKEFLEWRYKNYEK